MQPFDNKIQDVIKKFSYPVWFIIKDEDVDCPCVNHTTKQADPHCKKCLGLGKKITVARMNAAHQQIEDLSLRGEGMGFSEKNIASNYYTLADVEAREGDCIVDGNYVDIIQHFYPERSNHSAPVYYKYVASPKKGHYHTFLDVFKEVLSDAGYKP